MAILNLRSIVPKIEVSYADYFSIIFIFCLWPVIALAILEWSNRRSERSRPTGCRKLGLRVTSHLGDQCNIKYTNEGSAGRKPNGTPKCVVKSQWVFPIKSCSGVELNRGTVVATGMKYDRQFAFANLLSPFPVSSDATEKEKAKHDWTFITQRQYPRLALVKTEVWIPDPSSPTHSSEAPEVRSGGVLVITYPYQEDGLKGLLAALWAALRGGEPERSFQVPYDPTPEQITERGYTMDKMKIWKDSPEALNMGVDLPPELKYTLGVSHAFTLFRVDTRNHREVFRCAPGKEKLGYQPIIGFADAYPLHLLGLASARDVDLKIPRPTIPHYYFAVCKTLYKGEKGKIERKTMVKPWQKFGALRFRSNIIVTGPPAYAEDTWKKIRIGDSIYHVACRTARCQLPNVDPQTGQRHPKQPNDIMRSFRAIDEGADKNACLGMQMVPDKEESVIRVGDEVEVLETEADTGPHFYLKQ
ncbi:MAG: hypothetical protein M1827_004056 [Pycnora praestabilis]|nr:MAG: hypothetical protein M1827_004056 [Pycnora praestabilis]